MITTSRPVDVTTPLSRSRRFAPWLVMAGYLSIGVAAYWQAFASISSRPFVGVYEFEQSVWFLAWIPHALSHSVNPFFSNALLAPSGTNLAQNTASPLLGLATAPLSPFLDPMARANLLLVLAMPLSAASAYFVLSKWHVSVPAAALGGLIFGFSPYMVDQNVELVFLPLLPLIALVIVAIVQGKGSSLRLGIELGLLVTAQYLISQEILAIVALFIILGIAFAAVRDRSSIRSDIWRPIGIAAVVAAVLLAYPFWMLAAGPQHFSGPTWQTVNPYHNDVLSLIVPGSQQKVWFGMRSIGDRLGGSYGATGAGGYIGVVLLVIAGYLAWRSRKRLRTQVAVVLMLAALILSLGPYLTFDGRQTTFPLPFLLLQHIPLLNDILPSRLCLITDACLAAVISFGIDDHVQIDALKRSPRSRHQGRVRSISLITALVFGLIVATPPPQKVSVNSGPGFSEVALPAAIRQALPSGDPITLTYPYPSNLTMQPMLWQSNDGFQFRLLGGYAYHPNPQGGPSLIPSVMRPSGLQAFLVGQDPLTAYGLSPHYGMPLPLSDALVATTRMTLAAYDVRLVIVDTATSGSAPVVTLFKEALGPPTAVKGPFSVWFGTRERSLIPSLSTGARQIRSTSG